MSVVAELEPRAGRPYDVYSTYWLRANVDGTVSYCVTRREEAGAPNGAVYYFTGADEADALEQYQWWLRQRSETVVRQADRRAKWGPTGTGKLT